MKNMKYLNILGITEYTTDWEIINKQYKKLIKKYHPDINGFDNSDKAKIITAAYKENKLISVRLVAKEIKIPEREAFELLLQCIGLGILKIKFSVYCNKCNSKIIDFYNFEYYKDKEIECKKCKVKCIVENKNTKFCFETK